mgnify:CR=1 FL=1
MVELLAEHQSYEILQLLNVIVRVDSLLLAIRRNQTLVIKYMMQHRDRVRGPPPSSAEVRGGCRTHAKTRRAGTRAACCRSSCS